MPRPSLLVRSWPSRFCFATILSVVIGMPLARAVADEPARESAEATAKAKALVESMRKERERLVSGVVHVIGTVVFGTDEPDAVHPIRQMYAFDHAHRLLRCDSAIETQVRTINAANPAAARNDPKVALKAADSEQVRILLRYVRNRGYSAYWDKVSNKSFGSMYVIPVERKMGGSIASNHYLIDVRACGLMNRRQFHSGEFDRDQTVADLGNNLLKLDVVSVTENDGLAVIALHGDHIDHRLVIDVKHQYCPVEYTINNWKGGGNSSDHVHTSRVEWREVAGVMVPKAFVIEFDWPEERERARYRFYYNWSSVNQPVGQEYFDLRSVPDIPVNTKVIDTRAGVQKPVTIGVWTEEGYVGPDVAISDQPADGPSDKPIAPDAATILRAGERAGQERDDNAVKMSFMWCPPGKFAMCSPITENGRVEWEGPVDVVLTKGFWLGKYEVTQSQWKQLKQPPLWLGERQVKEGDDYPATYMNFNQALAFCERMTRQERAAGRLPAGWHYTLPTEAQWEYACRAGTATRFSFGDDESLLEDYAWVRSNTAGKNEPYAHPVGSKKPNGFGLHDMHGNVWEWCRDGFQLKLPGGTDPLAPTQEMQKVIRGGSWFEGFRIFSRSAMRLEADAVNMSGHAGNLGLRVALCPVD